LDIVPYFLLDEFVLKLVFLVVNIFMLNLRLNSLVEKIMFLKSLLLNHRHSFFGLIEGLVHGTGELLEFYP
jgi:hypothetical protein